MLDFLLVLGQIPGTSFQITFSEILIALLILFLYRWERTHRKEIRRELKYYYKRSRINIRKAKRHSRWFMLRQRRKVALGIYRFRRRQQLRIRQTRRMILASITSRYRRSLRLLKLRIRRTRRYLLAATIYRALRYKRQTQRSIRRTKRLYLHILKMRKNRLARSLNRRLRKLKNTKLAQAFYH